MTVTIERADEADLMGILALLRQAHLPTEGVRETLRAAMVARAGDRIVGCAALETYPSGVLVRSVAVDAEYRGRGFGQQLTEAALAVARERGASVAYLLTTTAGGFFPRFGFSSIARHEVPADVLTSIEFTTLCPASSLVMRANL